MELFIIIVVIFILTFGASLLFLGLRRTRVPPSPEPVSSEDDPSTARLCSSLDSYLTSGKRRKTVLEQRKRPKWMECSVSYCEWMLHYICSMQCLKVLCLLRFPMLHSNHKRQCTWGLCCLCIMELVLYLFFYAYRKVRKGYKKSTIWFYNVSV